MFKKTRLRNEIDKLIEQMDIYAPSSEEYAKAADNLIKLTQALENQSSATSKLRDGAIVAGTNFAGILVIANYEKLGVWTTKALNHIIKK